MMTDQVLYVVILALASCIARSGLNIIDRQSLGIRKIPVHDVMLFNTLMPSIIALLAAFCAGMLQMALLQLCDWRSFAFSATVQLVAYSFSYALRGHNIEDVVVSTKLPEVFTTLAYLLPIYSIATGSAIDIALSGMISAACVVFLVSSRATQALWIVPLCLILQASVSPFLSPSILDEGLEHSLSFAVATLCWRSVLSIAVSLRSSSSFRKSVSRIDAVLFLRALLAVITQVCLVLSLSFNYPAIAWSILNLTGAFSVVLSRMIFKSRLTGKLAMYLGIVIGLTVARSLYALFR
jgi:hypothetical protein